MPFWQIETIIANLEPDIRINISGGEPLSHPDFWAILQLCKEKSRDVWVYTNALEQIRYNTDIVKEIDCQANVCLVPGEYAYIPKKASKVHLLQLIPQGRAINCQPANISVSGNLKDCQDCEGCDHIVYQADGQVVGAPCKKRYAGE